MLLLLTTTIKAQATRKGTLIRIERCKLLSEGGYEILSATPSYETFVTITENKFSINSRESHMTLKLADQQLSLSEADTVYSYYTVVGKKLKMLAMRKCEDNFVVAIFPMDGDDKFTQYVIKPRKNDRHNNN